MSGKVPLNTFGVWIFYSASMRSWNKLIQNLWDTVRRCGIWDCIIRVVEVVLFVHSIVRSNVVWFWSLISVFNKTLIEWGHEMQSIASTATICVSFCLLCLKFSIFCLTPLQWHVAPCTPSLIVFFAHSSPVTPSISFCELYIKASWNG